jgi:uncharacterized protein YaiE (UPF0345 family)
LNLKVQFIPTISKGKDMSFKNYLFAGVLGVAAIAGTLTIGPALAKNMGSHNNATKVAIETNDYAAYTSAAKNRVMTKEQFDAKVANQATHKALELKLDKAVEANNFDAAKAVFAEMKATHAAREAQNPNANQKHSNRQNKADHTEAQLKTKFDEMVSKFKADGTLPSANKGYGMKGGRHGGKH